MTDVAEVSEEVPATTTETEEVSASPSKMDMALDDIVKGMRKPRRGGFRGRGRGRGRGGRGRSNNRAPKGAPPVPNPQGIHKLNISNLAFNVSDSDLTELFNDIGLIK